MRRVSSVALAGLLVLGACSGSDKADGNAAATPGGEATASSSDAGIIANPKPGLWEMAMARAGTPMGKPMQVCIGAPKPGENAFAPPSTEGTKCSKHEVKRISDGVQVEMQCTTDGVQTAGVMTVTGDFNSAFKNDMKMTMSGAKLPAGMPKEMEMSIDAKYLGGCPAGMEPGQVKL